MHYNSTRGPRNGNPNRPQATGPDCQGGSGSLEAQPAHLGSVGAGTTSTARSGATVPPADPRPHPGGQASLGLFGCTGVLSPTATEPAPAQSETRPQAAAPDYTEADRFRRPTIAEARQRREEAERLVAAGNRVRNAWLSKGSPLTPQEEEAARNPPKMVFGKPAAVASVAPAIAPKGEPSPVIAATLTRASDFPLLVRLAPSYFEDFARRAECEQCPVEEIITEVLSNYARHLRQCDLADAYDDPRPAPPTTPAMDLARFQSDERESGIDHGYEPDAYEFYLAHSAPVELALALH